MAKEPLSFTCVNCPWGCTLTVNFDEHGEIEEVSGYTCGRGLEYARQEALEPKRNISAVVLAKGSLEPLSVKTQNPIPKAKISEAMEQVFALSPKLPVEAGDVLLANVAGTGVSIVATKSLR